MALALVGTPTSKTIQTTSTTLSYTVPTGSDRFLVLGLAAWTAVGDPTINTLTYNSVAMTSIGSLKATGNKDTSFLYGLVAPTQGANNVAVTFAGDTYFSMGAVSFEGAHQTTPTGTYASAEGNSVTPSVNVASAAGEIVIDCTAYANAITALGGGQTERWRQEANEFGICSTEPGAGTVTMSYTQASGVWVAGGVSIKPSAAVGSLATIVIDPVALQLGLLKVSGG